MGRKVPLSDFGEIELLTKQVISLEDDPLVQIMLLKTAANYMQSRIDAETARRILNSALGGLNA
jgi:hypothetical protein